MTYSGHVRNGMVVLDGKVTLPLAERPHDYHCLGADGRSVTCDPQGYAASWAG